MMNFTVEEMNLITIYKADTRIRQVEKLRAVRSLYTKDSELLALLDSAARKIEAMTDTDFLATAFEIAAPVGYFEDESERFANGN